MFFKKKIVTPEMIDWHQQPHSLLLLDSHTHVSSLDFSNYPATRTLVVFIGGAKDDTYRPLLNGVFIPYRLAQGDHQDTCYATHAATKQVIQLIKHWHFAGQKVCLIGHSWGGKSVLRIAQKLSHALSAIPIELLITLDPVSRRFFRRQIKKPHNVKEWINVHIDYKKASMEYSNMIARFGGAWEYCQHADRNIKLSEDEAGEVTHVMASEMFSEVKAEVAKI